MNYLLLFFFILIGSMDGYSQQQESYQDCSWSIPMQIHKKTHPIDHTKKAIFKTEYSCDLNEFEITIFNRNGEVIFTTTDINNWWNAGHMKSSTYFWIIKGKYKDNKEFTKQGSLKVKYFV